MSTRPTVVSLTSLADAASVGVDLALEERTLSLSTTSDPTTLPYPGTIGIYPEPDPTLDPVLY